MADKTSLTHLKVRGDQLPRVEKRDAHCCVDQLKLNPELGVCMARPMIEKEGMSSSEVDCENLEACNFEAVLPFPVSWVLDFSWLSIVSQRSWCY